RDRRWSALGEPRAVGAVVRGQEARIIERVALVAFGVGMASQPRGPAIELNPKTATTRTDAPGVVIVPAAVRIEEVRAVDADLSPRVAPVDVVSGLAAEDEDRALGAACEQVRLAFFLERRHRRLDLDVARLLRQVEVRQVRQFAVAVLQREPLGLIHPRDADRGVE